MRILTASMCQNNGWLVYDEQYKLNKTPFPSSSCGIIDQELWILCVASSNLSNTMDYNRNSGKEPFSENSVHFENYLSHQPFQFQLGGTNRGEVPYHYYKKIFLRSRACVFSHFKACLFSSVFSLSFFALLRVGEITTESKSVLGPHVICRQDVNFNVINGRLELQLRIRSSKADQRQNSVTLIIPEQDTELCAVKKNT